MTFRHPTSRLAPRWLISAVALVLAAAGLALGTEPASLADRTWTWGYVIEGKVPGKVPFISDSGRTPFDGTSSCSLETGASYVRTPNVVFMNSNHNRASLTAENMARLASCKQIICALQHGAYADTAKKVSAFSKKYPRIVGGLIDDFREKTGPSKAITPQETKVIYDALRSENPSLRLYLVRYTWQDQGEMLPFLPYFDAINLWVWKAEREPWLKTLEPEIDKIAKLTGKPILLGLFIHDYGGTGKAVPMDILELQFTKAADLVRRNKIEGFVILQNGWFDHENHRPQMQWIRQYMNWLETTETVRESGKR